MRCSFVGLVLAIGCSLTAWADDPPAPKSEREKRLETMHQLAARFKVLKAADDEQPQPLIAAPLLRFDDPTRDFHDGTLWAWGERGRPLCLLAVEQYGQTMFEFISLADDKILAQSEGVKWQPQSPGLTLVPLADAPPPAKTAPRRLAQMKELLGELKVHEVGKTGARYELRLMPKPLYRYADAEADLQDGALFAFAYGTNPELLAVIEARGPADEAQWQVGFVRCGTAEPYVMRKDKEIFHLPYATRTTADDPYWNFAAKFPAKK
jgi:hypothetical protein